MIFEKVIYHAKKFRNSQFLNHGYVVCEMNFEKFVNFEIQNRVNFKEIRNYKPHNYEVFGTCFSCRFKIAPKSGKSIRACVTSV